MLNSIILSSLIVLLIVNWILDVKSRKDSIRRDLKFQNQINAITVRVNTLSNTMDKNYAISYSELETISNTIDSVQHKIAEIEVSIQNITNQR